MTAAPLSVVSDLATDVDTPVAALDISGATAAGATAAIDALDDAIDATTTARATFGAVQNRFESVISSLMVLGNSLRLKDAGDPRVEDESPISAVAQVMAPSLPEVVR